MKHGSGKTGKFGDSYKTCDISAVEDEYKRAKGIVEASETFLDKKLVDEAQAQVWEKTSSTIKRGSSSRARIRKFSIYGSVAASIAVALVFSLHLFSKQDNMVVITNDIENMSHVVLPDGSAVWLYYGTTLSYPKYFKETVREVHVSGEAFFDVVRDENIPFRVNTEYIGVTVLGTRFNVRTDNQEELAEVVLESGSVEVGINGKGEVANILLSPGEMAIAGSGMQQIEIKEVDLQLYTTWKDDYLNISSQSLSNVCILLGKRYKADIRIADKSLANEIFSGRFYKNQTLKEILDIVSLTTSVRLEIREGIYWLERE